jgi:hypothetical protein
MKRVGNIYSEICSVENIARAHDKAKKGKAHYAEVKMVNANPEKYFSELHEMLKRKQFRNSDYKIIQRTMDNGKVRTIHKLPYYPDRIVQHCIVNVLEPVWVKSMINDTYSCIKGRGLHKCANKLKQAVRNVDDTRYCLKMDVEKFYPNINHDILKGLLRRKIKDNDVLWLLDEIIDSAPGVPIGNYLSQFFGNLYLTGFDHWIKETKRIKHYFRYCDDLVILHEDKAFLHNLRREISDYLTNELKLKLKNNWQVFPVASRGIDFLGYRFYHNYTLLRKSIANKYKARIRHIISNWNDMSPEQVINSIMSYYGWMKHCNSRNLRNATITDEVFWIVKMKSQELGISNTLQGAV